MKKRKVISTVLSLAALLSGLNALPATAEDNAPVLDEGYTFIDIAHNGDTYVAMAKDASKTVARLYYSTDGGSTWSQTPSKRIDNAKISGNPSSQQQLVYWDDKNIFVAHGAASTFTSPDGVTWTENSNLHWTTNTYLTTEGGYLVLSGGSGDTSLNSTNDLNNKVFGQNKFVLNLSAGNVSAFAVKQADEYNNVDAFAAGRYYRIAANITLGTNKGTVTSSLPGEVFKYAPYDMVYAKNADQFLAVSGQNTLFATNDTGKKVDLTIKSETDVTGVSANDNYIVTGLSDGSIYYTENSEITADTKWTELEYKGTLPNGEKITNIEFSSDTSNDIVILGETQIYKGSIEKGYKNINETIEATPAAYVDAEVLKSSDETGLYIHEEGDQTPNAAAITVESDAENLPADNTYTWVVNVNENDTSYAEEFVLDSNISGLGKVKFGLIVFNFDEEVKTENIKSRLYFSTQDEIK